MTTIQTSNMPRRGFLAASTASLAAAYLGTGSSSAQQATAKWRRPNVNTPEGQKALKSYNKAIKAMLDLPPTDARNWYRNAYIHLLDCPHQNWWFLPWHRGYLGWFEQTCRELSGDPDFALPFWDWTTDPALPQAFFGQDEAFKFLNPANFPTGDKTSLFDYFSSALQGPTEAMWNAFSDAQATMIGYRNQANASDYHGSGFASFEDFWTSIVVGYPGDKSAMPPVPPTPPIFPGPKDAFRSTTITPENPGLLVKDENGKWIPDPSVAGDVIDAALNQGHFSGSGKLPQADPKSDPNPHDNPADLIGRLFGFGSDMPAPTNNLPPINHSMWQGESTLEAGPHDNVHNDLGGSTGFMGQFLSPLDPIFFLHHGNIDRLWHIWNLKQKALGQSVLPLKPDHLALWQKEPFLFYIDSKGNPVTDPAKTTAGAYAEIGDFHYDYGAGYGDQFKPAPPSLLAGGLFAAKMKILKTGDAAQGTGSLLLPEKLASAVQKKQAPLLARITFKAGATPPGSKFKVLVNPGADALKNGIGHPTFAALIRPFSHGQNNHQTTFTVSLSAAIRRLKIDPKAPLNIHVVQIGEDGKAVKSSTSPVDSIVVGS
jgi:hypothetical protein